MGRLGTLRRKGYTPRPREKGRALGVVMNAELPPDIWSQVSWDSLLTLDWAHVVENLLSSFLAWACTIATFCVLGLYKLVFRKKGLTASGHPSSDPGSGAVQTPPIAAPPKSRVRVARIAPAAKPQPANLSGDLAAGSGTSSGDGATLWQIAYLVDLGVPEWLARTFSKKRAGAEIGRRKKARDASQPKTGSRHGKKKA